MRPRSKLGCRDDSLVRSVSEEKPFGGDQHELLLIIADKAQFGEPRESRLGVDERRLFPDLDGVAAAIRRYYA